VNIDPVQLVALKAALLGEEADLSELLIAALARDAAAGLDASRPRRATRPVPPLSNAAMRVVEMHRARILVAGQHYGTAGLAAIAAGNRCIGVPLW
jgi:hypothetical protein